MSAACSRRRERLLQALPPGAVALVAAGQLQLRNGDVHHPFRQSSDFYYLTDFDEPNGLLVLRPGADLDQVLFCSPRDADKERWDGPIAGPEGAAKQTGVEHCRPLTDLRTVLPSLLKGSDKLCWSHSSPGQAARIAHLLGEAGIEVADRGADLDPHLHSMRLCKDKEELQRMRVAAEITTAAHERMIAAVRPGIREYQLEAECLFEFHRRGAAGPAYPSIVGSGGNACVLHYVRNDAELKDGDLVLVDAGCEYRGYAADITRTFPVSGRFSPEQRAIYELVLQAQCAVIAQLAPGVPYSHAQQTAVAELTAGLKELGLLSGSLKELIATNAVRTFYMHRVGHWLGLDVHDVGKYQDEAGESVRLQEGMVMTVEPGIYIDATSPAPAAWHNIGVRIEDDLLITADGAEVLGASPPSDPDEVEALAGSAL